MPYLTLKTSKPLDQITIDDCLAAMRGHAPVFTYDKHDTEDTKTFFKREIDPRIKESFDVDKAYRNLKKFCNKYKDIIDVENKKTLYHTISLDKKDGGKRWIHAPSRRVKEAAYELRDMFEREFFAKYHTAAFAFIKHRGVKDAWERHQHAKTNWFLKTDIHDFFGSITSEFTMRMLRLIFPFSELFEKYGDDAEKYLRMAMSPFFWQNPDGFKLKDGLIQGSPISPMITNLVMIPIDHKIAKLCREGISDEKKLKVVSVNVARDLAQKTGQRYEVLYLNGAPIYEFASTPALLSEVYPTYADAVYKPPYLVYTRYCDNMMFSSKVDFRWTEVKWRVYAVFKEFGAPFLYNDKLKKPYGNRNGHNIWLGVILNKDGKLSIGHEKRKRFKAALYQFAMDFKNGNPWPKQRTYVLCGLISWYSTIQAEDIKKLVALYSLKSGVDIKKEMKTIIASSEYVATSNFGFTPEDLDALLGEDLDLTNIPDFEDNN